MEELDRQSNIEVPDNHAIDGKRGAPGDTETADSARVESASATAIDGADMVEDGFKGEEKATYSRPEASSEVEAQSAAITTAGKEPDKASDSEAGKAVDKVASKSADKRAEVPEVSRKVRRRRKRSRPRSKTIAMKRLTREELRRGALLYPPVEVPRPQTRAECKVEQRPCPWVACKHHLYLDVNPETGSIKLNFPDLEPWELSQTCALDVAERGGITLEEVGEIMNLTRERIRQVEVRGLLKLRMASPSPEELGANLLVEE